MDGTATMLCDRYIDMQVIPSPLPPAHDLQLQEEKGRERGF